jgi:hypothetical protein
MGPFSEGTVPSGRAEGAEKLIMQGILWTYLFHLSSLTFILMLTKLYILRMVSHNIIRN